MTTATATRMESPAAQAAPRCVLLAQPQRLPPAGLLAGLRHRAVATQIVRHPAAAMLALAKQPVLALVIIEPEGQPQLTALIEAARHYYPHVPLWRSTLSPQGRVSLSRFPAEDSPDAHGGSPSHSPQRSVSPKPSGLSGAPAWSPWERPESPLTPRPVEHEGEPLVSAEEMAMLLGPMEE